MSQEIEIEFKNLVTQDEFEKLLKAFHIEKSYFKVQHNDYFDTPSFGLKAKGSALRIREKQGKFVLTLKEPGEIGLVETHQSLTDGQAQMGIKNGVLPQGEVLDTLCRLNISPNQLVHLGRLTTNRAEIPYNGGLLVFDHSLYGQKEDYELEFESTDAVIGEKVFLELLREFGIPKRPTQNKIQRLMNSIIDIKKKR